MSKKVFVLGAGFNQFLKKNFNYFDENAIKELGFRPEEIILQQLSPPMSKNFFKYCILKQLETGEIYYGINNKVLDYIEKNFNRPRSILLTHDFDLELFFTFIEAQIYDAKYKNDEVQLSYLEEIRLNLIIAIGNTFFYIEWRLPYERKELLKMFGKIIYETKSDVVTFNYDGLAEWGIEQASGHRSAEDWLQSGMYHNWNRHLSYGINFTKIRTGHLFGYYDAESGPNVAKKIYKNILNTSSEFKFIKLHGSYNWYRYSNFKRQRTSKKLSFSELLRSNKLYLKSKKVPESLKDELISFNGDWQYGLLPTWDHYSFRPRYRNVLEPIIIPPILIKEHELRKELFQQLWNQAKKSLLECEELIFIGYSFPDTDFYSKKLFIEAFSENKNIKVTMVNPDRTVATKFRKLVNYRGRIKRYSDSGEFIKNFEQN